MNQNRKGLGKLTSVFVIVGSASARRLIRKTIESMPQFILLGVAANQVEAARKWSVQPQLMLIDAERLASKKNSPAKMDVPQIVLIGGADYPAAVAYKTGAVDFLSVPLERTVLKESLQRICPTSRKDIDGRYARASSDGVLLRRDLPLRGFLGHRGNENKHSPSAFQQKRLFPTSQGGLAYEIGHWINTSTHPCGFAPGYPKIFNNDLPMTMSFSQEPVLRTLKQAAQLLSISKRTLERLIAGGSFPPPLKIGRASRIASEDVNCYLRELVKRRTPNPADSSTS